MASTAIVTVNAGSSSIKLAVFSVDAKGAALSRLLDIAASNIGQSVATLQTKHVAMDAKVEEVHSPNYVIASDMILQKLAQTLPADTIMGIGHRLVHGGGRFAEPILLKDIADADWEYLSQLDSQHTPVARQIIARFAELYPSIPQVACFDTAFFDSLPEVAKLVPIPKKYYGMGVRRYGFHGLSYTSLLETFREKAGEAAVQGRVILAHLGSGASVTATQFGKPVDTTMGFTPASGVPMSTRSGDLDPNTFSFLHRQSNMTADEFDHMVNFESGLLGVSGTSGDMQTLLNLEDKNEDAAAAVELFVRDVRKSIGALTTVLGGVDSLIFSGGIGEQSSLLRGRICQGLGYLGIEVDEVANEQHSFLISTRESKVGVHVLPADEAHVIATQTMGLLNKSHGSY